MGIEAAALPVGEALGRIAREFESAGILILSAEAGAGKTTLVPPGLLEAGLGRRGKILVLEPRRIAAIQAAARIAELLGEELGGRVGYKVRGEGRESGSTRILFLTEALLTRFIQEDPELSGVDILIFDEYHERSIHTDLALALALEARLLRPELKLLIMSATLDAQALSAFIKSHQGRKPALIDVPGRAFPVDIFYRPLPRRGRFEEEYAQALLGIASETEGDILAFLPGRAEIERVSAALRLEWRGPAALPEILILHGSLDVAQQRQVVRGPDNSKAAAPRRIILSTSIAQTSLTIPGIKVVVDSGLNRLSRFHLGSGMDRLVTESESRRDAVQRAGRAGRLGPGRAYRLWAEANQLPEETEPEILRADLSALVLEACIWGARGPKALPFPNPAPSAAWQIASSLLEDLGLIDAEARVLDLGKRCARLGLSPRLGAMVVSQGSPLAAACAALLEEGDHPAMRGDANFSLRLESLRSGNSAERAWRERVLKEARRICKAANIKQMDWSPGDEGLAGSCLLSAYPDRLCRLQAGGNYRFPSGREARLGGMGRGTGAGSLEGREWLVAPEVDSGESLGLIHLAASLETEEVAALVYPRAEAGFSLEWRLWSPRPRRELLLGKLSLGSPSLGSPSKGSPSFAKNSKAGGTSAELETEARQAILDSIAQRVEKEGLVCLPWSESALCLLERARALSSAVEGLPALDESAMAASIKDWLFPFLNLSRLGQSQGALPPVIDAEGLSQALAFLLNPCRARIEREAPESVSLPTGAQRRLLYGEGDQAILEARVQELFGLTEQPRAAGRPILIRLLSPSGRPVQSTSDIGGFWKNSYPEVRKELRGRYPKHYWPEDGERAQATSRAKPRAS